MPRSSVKKTPQAGRAPVQRRTRSSPKPAPARAAPASTAPDPPAAAPPAGPPPWLTIRGARQNNLQNLTVAFPLQRLVVVTGVSGSGKSSLVNDVLRNALERRLNEADVVPGEHDALDGVEHLDKVIAIDQSPIGRTPRSNPATYTKVFDLIRDLYADLPESKLRGWKVGRFSFNVPTEKGGGRCEACEGNGALALDMDFLADVWVPCTVCDGKRFSTETLGATFKGQTIADVLDLEVEDALELFANQPKLATMLATLHSVGLDYIKLGQPAPTLSGGEAQRVKLARELARPPTGRTLYILDEPTTGLHFEDVRRLLDVLQRLVDKGNSVVVIEHHLDVIKQADWVIDLGPEGGAGGGQLVAAGTPEQVAAVAASHTGQALRAVLGQGGGADGAGPAAPFEPREPPAPATVIAVRGASQNNLKNIDVDLPRGAMTVTCGLSGSGKSTLAMDTIYTEGQRRYVESLSSYARQFLGQLAKPKVESISGLSPAIAIEQKNTVRSPRSTVGTVTEIHDYLRVIWARLGVQFCPDHPTERAVQHKVDEAVAVLQGLLADGRTLLLGGPVPGDTTRAGEISQSLTRLKEAGVRRVWSAGQLVSMDDALADPARVLPAPGQPLMVVLDRLAGKTGAGRIAEAIELAWRLCDGWAAAVVDGVAAPADGAAPAPDIRFFSAARHCPVCRLTFERHTPHHFSFNAAVGWCPACQGLGVQRGADASAFIVRPGKSLFDNAIEGWGDVDPDSLFGRCLVALHDHLGVPRRTAWSDWPADAQHRFLHGTGADWLAVRPGPQDPAPRRGSASATPPLSFQWKGLFPALDQLTRISWVYRHRLAHLLSDVDCRVCGGGRLNRVASAVRVTGPDGQPQTLHEVCQLSLADARRWFDNFPLDAEHRAVVGDVLDEVRSRLRFLVDVGLGYLSLARNTATLSGGESQRVQLASQVGRNLTGVLYVLDEPTIGLHPQDNHRLIAALQRLRDLGNTLLVVEHDRDVIAHADHLLELGPGAGREGGSAVASGPPATVAAGDSLTGQYLSGRKAVPVPAVRRDVCGTGVAPPEPVAAAPRPGKGKRGSGKAPPPAPPAHVPDAHPGSPVPWVSLYGAALHNLKRLDVHLPLGRLVCLTGVSGSGKSSLVQGVLWPLLARQAGATAVTPGPHRAASGLERVQRAVMVDQAPIGNTPTSTPITYVGAYDAIRELFGRLPESRQRGWRAGHFSFNRAGGRCEACEGMGQRCIEMHFLPDVWVTCEHCNGRRFTAETQEVKFRGASIADVLELRVDEALRLFEAVPAIARPLATLADVGLGYLQLGQSATTLSGGEAQRVKLAAELGSGTGATPTFYLLDEPTTGLHFDDVAKLIEVMQRLVDGGHTLLVIEHNLDVIKSADWVLELGPEAGAEGGYLVAAGTPEEVAAGTTPTARFLAEALAASPKAAGAGAPAQSGAAASAAAPPAPADADEDIALPWVRFGSGAVQDRLQAEPPQWDPRLLTWLVDRALHHGGEALAAAWDDPRQAVVRQTNQVGTIFAKLRVENATWLEVQLRVPPGHYRDEDLRVLGQLDPSAPRAAGRTVGSAAYAGSLAGGEGVVKFLLVRLEDVDRPAFDRFLRGAVEDFLAGRWRQRGAVRAAATAEVRDLLSRLARRPGPAADGG